jgi:glutaredoxin
VNTELLRRCTSPLLLAAAAWGAVQLLKTDSEYRLGQALAASAGPGDIVMLSSESCPYCMQARLWLQRYDVRFSECFIERDAACARQYEALQSPGTPTMVVRGERQIGFDPQRVAWALKAG